MLICTRYEDDSFTFEVLAVQQVTVALPTTAAPVRGVTLAHGEQLETMEIAFNDDIQAWVGCSYR